MQVTLGADCIKGILTDASVEEVTMRHREQTDANASGMTLEQMIAKAREGYFVRFKIHMDERKMDNRKCLSEHPFGTIKRTIGEGFFLLRRMFKTERVQIMSWHICFKFDANMTSFAANVRR